MSGNLDLKTIRVKIYGTIIEDGLLEIMIGVYFILSSIFLSNRAMILNFLWLPVAPVLIEVIRRRYIYPRAGYAKISLSVVEIITILTAILVVVIILAGLIGLFAMGTSHPLAKDWRSILIYALILATAISFCFIAYRFGAVRWYMHGVSMGVIFLLGKLFNATELVLLLGIWITLVGIAVFIRFTNRFRTEPDQNPSPGLDTNGETEVAEVSNAR
jgi:hypothetical protein